MQPLDNMIKNGFFLRFMAPFETMNDFRRPCAIVPVGCHLDSIMHELNAFTLFHNDIPRAWNFRDEIAVMAGSSKTNAKISIFRSRIWGDEIYIPAV